MEGRTVTTFIFLSLFILLMIIVVKSSLGKPNLLLKASMHILGGIVGLWLADLLLSVVGIGIPINVFTVLLVGLLGLPGVGLLAVLQVMGI
jgi:inhibitor of the pro-sigma K processing machinery